MFLDMFEDEYRQIQLNPIRLEYILEDSCMLYPPTTTPLSGVEFAKRLPSGDIERARRVRKSGRWNRPGSVHVLQAIRVFFLLRGLSLDLRSASETELPLTKPENLYKENDKLDLSKCSGRMTMAEMRSILS